MREFSRVSSTFWTGETCRYLRRFTDAQRLALYYLPIPVICHELGISMEGASKGLRRASEGGGAAYDEASEVVFVYEMARFQIGLTLAPNGKRAKLVKAQLESLRQSRLHPDFLRRYGVPFHLGDLG